MVDRHVVPNINPSSVLAPRSDATSPYIVTSSFLFLVVRPGAPSSVRPIAPRHITVRTRGPW